MLRPRRSAGRVANGEEFIRFISTSTAANVLLIAAWAFAGYHLFAALRGMRVVAASNTEVAPSRRLTARRLTDSPVRPTNLEDRTLCFGKPAGSHSCTKAAACSMS